MKEPDRRMDSVLRHIAPALADLLADIAGHRCRFVLVAWPQGRAHWIVSEAEAGDVLAAFKKWLPYFTDPDHKPFRAGEADEAKLAQHMRPVAETIADVLEEKHGEKYFSLVVFPREVGMYCANISRDSAVPALNELLPYLETALSHRSN